MRYFQLKTTKSGLKLFFLESIIFTTNSEEKKMIKKVFDGLNLERGKKGSKKKARKAFLALSKSIDKERERKK